ncbi:MAG: polysaccharide biosynthesis C-terminal domain-containing protein [Clostridia bacterium]|nr:polysaccharide biosynthesis C-terminal domain-containing protein [Clostridia bacterium]
MAKAHAREIFISGVVLSATALIMRTVGVAFNVYVSGKIGAAGMGLLSLIMSVYSLSVTFSVSGISLAATRLTAEAVGSSKKEDIRHAMRRCLIYSLSFGMATFLVLFNFAEQIAVSWLNDVRCTSSVKLFAVSMPFISMSSAMHGYFNALRRVVKSASAQFLEQFIKISVTSLLLTLIAPRGIEYACMAVIGGGSVAEIASFFFTYIVYRYDLRKSGGSYRGSGKGLTRKMCRIAMPVAFSAYLRTGLVTLEHMLIPRGLKKYGASSEHSLETYGVLQGMVLPIILFPTAFLSSFNTLLIPELAQASAGGEKRHIDYIGERFLRFTLMFSFGVCGVMICFSHELGYVIYNSHSASDYIKTVAPLIPIMYFDSAVDSMLKGLDEQLFNMRINIIDAASSAFLVYILCPKIGIMGYIVTIFASEIFNLSCSFVRLMNVTGIRPRVITWIVKPMICALASCTLVRIALEAVRGIAYSYVSLFVHIILVLGVYVLLLILTYTLDREDREWICSLFRRR